jgi:glycosyltransferase involved in cell wall biosynthesis
MNEPERAPSASRKRRILWVAPALNAYKLQFLNRLFNRGQLDIIVAKGQLESKAGHKEGSDTPLFPVVEVAATESNFQFRLATYSTLARVLRGSPFDYVLIPAEMKHLGVVLFLFLLKFYHRFQLVTYTHPYVAWNWPAWLSRPLTRIVFSLHDKVIFYTDQAKERNLQEGILPLAKAFSANNTLDTDAIWKNYGFETNRSTEKRILYIGRLTANKGIETLFEYYAELRKEGVRLAIIGDGPERGRVVDAVTRYPEIEWLGAVEDERVIAHEMRRTHLVFVPGHSGLSIVHSFCYGKPYVTLAGRHHPPEIDYLEDRRNGLLLAGNLHENVAAIVRLLTDEKAYEGYCQRAFDKAQSLTVANWCGRIESALS